MKPRVRVCINETCCSRGSERVFSALEKNLDTEITLEKSKDCFRYCKLGPNASVDGHVLHHLSPENVVSRVRQELRRPGIKKDGVGTRPIDDLDSALDELTSL